MKTVALALMIAGLRGTPSKNSCAFLERFHPVERRLQANSGEPRREWLFKVPAAQVLKAMKVHLELWSEGDLQPGPCGATLFNLPNGGTVSLESLPPEDRPYRCCVFFWK